MPDLRSFSLSSTWHAVRRVSRILWVRVALIAALSVGAALLAPVARSFVSQDLKDRLTEEATLPILNVLATSLLAVATFSLAIMVSSHRALSAQTTPRLHQILMQDTRTQTVIATFIGGFIFALSSIIMFRAKVYGEGAAVVVFLTSVVVVLVIIVSLVRWIGHLSLIGSLSYALDEAETAAEAVMSQLRAAPRYGGARHDTADGDAAEGVVVAPVSGYVLFLKMDALHSSAEEKDGRVFVDVLPGEHVLKGDRLARFAGGGDAEDYAACIVIGRNRSHEQDPSYPIEALRESASKALSPGINDPGTALDIVARLERVLWAAFAPVEDDQEISFDRVHVRDVDRVGLVETAFRQIAKDGRDNVGVIGAVARAVDRLGDRLEVGAADALLADIDAYAEDGLTVERDRQRYADLRDGT